MSASKIPRMHSAIRSMIGAMISVVAIGVVIFAIENNQPISLIFFGWSSPSLPIALYIVSALLVGLVIGLVISWLARARIKRKIVGVD